MTNTTARPATLSGVAPKPFDYANKAARLEIELSELRAATKSLAVRYASYLAACEAKAAGKVNGSVVVWGEMLLEAQKAAGVNLITPKVIQAHIDQDREDVKADEAAARRTWNQR